MKVIHLVTITLVTFLLSVLSSCFGQVVSYPVNSPEINSASEGFYYALPSHTIKIEVRIKKTERFKGKFSDHATKLLGITEVITKDATSYEIDDIKVSTLVEADSNYIYYAQLPAGLDDDKTFMVNLTELGLLSGVNISDREDLPKYYNSAKPFRDLLKPVLIEKVDTIIRRVSIDTTIIEEKVLKRSISEKSNEQQAREIADLIYRIEDSKFSLVTGYQEVNYSRESLKFMLDKLNTMEREYLAFFKGSVIESENVFTYYYTPENKSRESLNTLFRFSASEGIAEAVSKSGDAVNISLTPEKFYLKVHELEKKRFEAKRKGKGIFYRIPESVNIRITTGNKVLASERSFISQLGIISFLPYSNLSTVEFSESGSLKSLILE